MKICLNKHIKLIKLVVDRQQINNAFRRCYQTTPALMTGQSSPVKAQQSAQYCLDLVRQYDYENFLCTLLLDGIHRQSALGVRAFNVEVSKIASVVSDNKIGLMRLNFWSNAIESIYSPATENRPLPDHPVIKQLKVTVDRHKLPRLYFTRLIKSRERSSNLTFVTGKELEAYAEESTSSLLYLLARIIGADAVDMDHALSHLGKAQGITNMLRAQSAQSRAFSICIPQETLLKHGCNHESVIRDRVNDKAVQECTFDVASMAFSHLEKARKLSDKIPASKRRLLLPAIAIERYLERLRRANFHLSDASVTKRDSMLPMAFYWNYFKKKY